MEVPYLEEASWVLRSRGVFGVGGEKKLRELYLALKAFLAY